MGKQRLKYVPILTESLTISNPASMSHIISKITSMKKQREVSDEYVEEECGDRIDSS
jgi:hypothetical protein